MIAALQTGIARRKRTILYGAEGNGGALESVLSSLATEVKAHLQTCTSVQELTSFADREHDSLCLIVLDAHFPKVLESARSVMGRAALSELVLLASAEEQAQLTLQMGVAPRLGAHWQYLSLSPGLERNCRAIFQRADQRRATRTTLDRFNARLTAPAEPVDTRELRRLVISDRFLSSILESAFDAVILVDRSGAVAPFNPSAERLFGKSQKEVISRPICSLSEGRWDADTRTIFASPQQGRLIHTLIEVESGTRHIEISATPVYDRLQNLLATLLILRDITDRLQAEQALRTNEKLAAVGRLASAIAHEINNPLEAVTNLLYLARQSAETPEMQEYLDTADQELRRIATITNQTLGFHKQATSTQSLSAEALFQSVLSVYKPRLMSLGVEVRPQFRATTPVSCFEGEIRQVLNNLVGNALDAMSTAGGRLLIRSHEEVHPTSGAKGLVLTVADTGTGMSSGTSKRVFEAFYTTKGLGGTGLGLWISAEIVARHRGSLKVRSTQRESRSGTVFRLFLPFER